MPMLIDVAGSNGKIFEKLSFDPDSHSIGYWRASVWVEFGFGKIGIESPVIIRTNNKIISYVHLLIVIHVIPIETTSPYGVERIQHLVVLGHHDFCVAGVGRFEDGLTITEDVKGKTYAWRKVVPDHYIIETRRRHFSKRVDTIGELFRKTVSDIGPEIIFAHVDGDGISAFSFDGRRFPPPGTVKPESKIQGDPANSEKVLDEQAYPVSFGIVISGFFRCPTELEVYPAPPDIRNPFPSHSSKIIGSVFPPPPT